MRHRKIGKGKKAFGGGLGLLAAGEENRQADADDEPARESEPHEERSVGPEVVQKPRGRRPGISGAHVGLAPQPLFTVTLQKRLLLFHNSFHTPRHWNPSLLR